VENIEKITAAIKAGESLLDAAHSVGISERTIRRWRAQAEREAQAGEVGLASAFVDCVTHATLEVKESLTSKLMRAAREGEVTETEIIDPETGKVLRKRITRRGPDPRLVLQILSRKDPEGWGAPGTRKAKQEKKPVGEIRFYDHTKVDDAADEAYIAAHTPSQPDPEGKAEGEAEEAAEAATEAAEAAEDDTILFELPRKREPEGKDAGLPWTDAQIRACFGPRPTLAQLRTAERADNPPVFDDVDPAPAPEPTPDNVVSLPRRNNDPNDPLNLT